MRTEEQMRAFFFAGAVQLRHGRGNASKKGGGHVDVQLFHRFSGDGRVCEREAAFDTVGV